MGGEELDKKGEFELNNIYDSKGIIMACWNSTLTTPNQACCTELSSQVSLVCLYLVIYSLLIIIIWPKIVNFANFTPTPSKSLFIIIKGDCNFLNNEALWAFLAVVSIFWEKFRNIRDTKLTTNSIRAYSWIQFFLLQNFSNTHVETTQRKTAQKSIIMT